MKLSAVLIVKNEEANLGRCLKALQWADEITVLDTGSTDATMKIAADNGARVFVQTKWEGFGKAKQEAVDLARYDWILSIDADEVLSLELQQELIQLRNKAFENCAWRIKRRSYYLGRAIKHCGWNHDAPIRLFNRTAGRFNSNMVHEGIITQMPVRTCRQIMDHHTYPNVESHFAKMRSYSELWAHSESKKGRRSGSLFAIIQGGAKFIKMYLLQLGFLDGHEGFLLCKNSAWGVWYKYHYLARLGK